MVTSEARRPPWAAAPAGLHEQVQLIAGSATISTHDVRLGMSPGPAAILTLEDGGRVFVKAVSRHVSAGSHRFYEREASVLAALPPSTPAPRLLGFAECEGWIALVMTVAAGEPAGPPWTARSVRLVAAACDTIAAVRAPTGVPEIAELLIDLDGWQKLPATDEWERRHAPALAQLAEGWPEWTAGETLVHQDVRADNAVVGQEATLVDWSFGCAGANWLDRARLAADIMCSGHRDGPSAALSTALAILESLPGEPARFVAALAGMWRYRSTLPPLPGLPTLRRWQHERAQAVRPLLTALLSA